ncbi:MAG TPA: GGDEF domain-containing phosphodiesterase, partial [Desulfuromonadales bacterium]|nr:GGDEF domain-containing phosphodiesterase [Desulfuromonadales bacterium]
SLSPRDGADGETLIKNADVAMYRAKKKGGNTFLYFAPEMNLHSTEVLEMEADLRRALERQEFVLHFQPKVDLVNGRIFGSEALVRWNHPEKGMISPGSFIPLAEEIGLIVPLGLWVLEEACRCNRRWQEAGFDPGTVSVNLSARQFREADLPSTIEQALEKNGMAPHLLDLELTETMVMDDPQKAVETMQRLKTLGICLSLDDFGTGYSSLNYLRWFPVDTLKIDRSFIVDAVESPTGASLTTSVIALAHSLNLVAVAEGVETLEQLQFLKNCSCDSFQGFFFSKPVPADEFETMLRQKRKLEM